MRCYSRKVWVFSKVPWDKMMQNASVVAKQKDTE